eukprot:COSAG06_NODE_26778_length_607_cov_1.594488_1_plen_33_part_10
MQWELSSLLISYKPCALACSTIQVSTVHTIILR